MKERDKFTIAGAFREAWREFYENRREQLMRAFGLFGLMLVAAFCFFWATCSGGVKTPANCVSNLEDAFMFIFFAGYMGLCVMSSFSASMMLPQLTSKERRLAFFMTPVNMLEKYVGQLLFYVIGFFMMYMLFWAAVTVLAPMLAKICFPGGFNLPDDTTLFDVCKKPFMRLWSSEDVPSAFKWMFIPMVFVGSSFYVAGSAFFGKYAFIKTTVALWVLQTAVSMIIWIPVLILGVRDMLIGVDYTMGDGFYNAALILCIIGMIVLVGFNWWFGYYRLKETDIQ